MVEVLHRSPMIQETSSNKVGNDVFNTVTYKKVQITPSSITKV
jgi:hypothetical protein